MTSRWDRGAYSTRRRPPMWTASKWRSLSRRMPPWTAWDFIFRRKSSTSTLKTALSGELLLTEGWSREGSLSTLPAFSPMRSRRWRATSSTRFTREKALSPSLTRRKRVPIAHWTADRTSIKRTQKAAVSSERSRAIPYGVRMPSRYWTRPTYPYSRKISTTWWVAAQSSARERNVPR